MGLLEGKWVQWVDTAGDQVRTAFDHILNRYGNFKTRGMEFYARQEEIKRIEERVHASESEQQEMLEWATDYLTEQDLYIFSHVSRRGVGDPKGWKVSGKEIVTSPRIPADDNASPSNPPG